jgi:hypothetical protein
MIETYPNLEKMILHMRPLSLNISVKAKSDLKRLQAMKQRPKWAS